MGVCYSAVMRAVVQRVKRASVTIGGCTQGAIGSGLCVFVGIAANDSSSHVDYLVDKICNLRIFPDAAGKMNLSVLDSAGAILAVSQFTLYGDARKGRRPAFVRAMEPKQAQSLYNLFVERLAATGVQKVQTGVFRADMEIELVNDGPVTILLDSERTF